MSQSRPRTSSSGPPRCPSPRCSRRSTSGWPAFPDAPGALAELRERYRLVALTNADNWALRQMSAPLGDPFDDSVTAEDVGVNKPSPPLLVAGRPSRSGQGRVKAAPVSPR